MVGWKTWNGRVYGELDCPTSNNEKSHTIMAIGIRVARWIVSLLESLSLYVSPSANDVPIVAYLCAVIMQGYQNVRAVCSAHYEPAGARSKRAFSILRTRMHFSMEGNCMVLLARVDFNCRRYRRKDHQSVKKSYFDPGQGTLLITWRFFARGVNANMRANSDNCKFIYKKWKFLTYSIIYEGLSVQFLIMRVCRWFFFFNEYICPPIPSDPIIILMFNSSKLF